MKKITPKFINEGVIKKYEIQFVDSIINEKIHEFKLSEGFNRISIESAEFYKIYHYQTAFEAKNIVLNLIKNVIGKLYVIWANGVTSEILADVNFIRDHFDSVMEEDWDFWLIYEDKFIVETYHEGEIVFIPNQNLPQ